MNYNMNYMESLKLLNKALTYETFSTPISVTGNSRKAYVLVALNSLFAINNKCVKGDFVVNDSRKILKDELIELQGFIGTYKTNNLTSDEKIIINRMLDEYTERIGLD